MKNIEIEVKLEINENQYNDLIEVMKEKANLVKDSHQTDIYYSPVGEDYFQVKTKALRVRDENGKQSFDYKEIFFENDPEKKYIKEVSVKIDDYENLDEILMILGVNKIITLKKHRQDFDFENAFMISIDKIDDLGYFAEIELTKEVDTIEEGNALLQNVIKQLSLQECPVNTKGYANMLYAKTYANK